jgi:hypothetical protein
MSWAYLHFDDLYQYTTPISCVHEQKACMHYELSMRIDLKHTEAIFFAEFVWFVSLMSRSGVEISRIGNFCANNDTINYFTPSACVRGNNCTVQITSNTTITRECSHKPHEPWYMYIHVHVHCVRTSAQTLLASRNQVLPCMHGMHACMHAHMNLESFAMIPNKTLCYRMRTVS